MPQKRHSSPHLQRFLQKDGGEQTEQDSCEELATGTCCAAANAFPCSCPCSKGCLSLSRSPQSLHSDGHLNPPAGFVYEETGMAKAFRGAEEHTEALSQLAQIPVFGSGLIHIFSSLKGLLLPELQRTLWFASHQCF